MATPEDSSALHGFQHDARKAAHAAGRQVSEAASDIAGAARATARATAEALSAQAASLMSNVADELGSTADEQKQRGADAMVGVAHAIDSAAAELEKQSPTLARQFRSASDSIENLSGRLRDRKPRELIDDLSDLARRQPTAFFAGAIIAGFALSRFLKSSAAETVATHSPGRTEGYNSQFPPSPGL